MLYYGVLTHLMPFFLKLQSGLPATDPAQDFSIRLLAIFTFIFRLYADALLLHGNNACVDHM